MIEMELQDTDRGGGGQPRLSLTNRTGQTHAGLGMA